MTTSIKKFLLTFSLFIVSSSQLLAHKNFWEIKATVVPEESSMSFNLLLSLAQINDFFEVELGLEEYRPEIAPALKAKLVKLVPLILSLRDQSGELSPFVKKVDIYIDESLKDEEVLDLSSVDIDIELIYFTNSSKVEGTWFLFADSLVKQKATDTDQLPEGALNVNIIFLDDALSKASVNSGNPDFTWERKKSLPVEPLQVVEKNTTIEEKATYLPAILVLFALVYWTFIPSKTSIFISGLLIAFSILTHFTPVSSASRVLTLQTLPEENEVSAFMDKALRKIYISTTAGNKNLKWDTLEGLLTKRQREKVFMANYSLKEKDIPYFVESTRILNLTILSDSKVECSWEANALFQHTSHIHEKTISFKGTFHFEPVGRQWLISDVNIRRNL
ncbi:MAG: hypothetical protein NE327_22805 [Lentisphaeraceae bacterium]|nr:hypothetical protein [Lentisphaeraceae bacterium]